MDFTKPDDCKRTRIRKEDGGRKPTTVNEPQLLNTITEIIEGSTYGDPERILLWTNLPLRNISEELKKLSIIAGKDVVSRALDQLGYIKQTNRKLLQAGPQHPGRNEIFTFINEQAKLFINGVLQYFKLIQKKRVDW